MFLSNDDIERTSLRQGDIVAGIHLLGAINIKSIHYSSPANDPKALASWNIPSAPKFGNVMVVSHSCEITLENKVKVTSIILAPLRDIYIRLLQKIGLMSLLAAILLTVSIHPPVF